MTLLHLLSNHKWTERAEPATSLVRAQRVAGATAGLVCRGYPREVDKRDSIVFQASRQGVEPHVIDMRKHFHLPILVKGCLSLRRLVRSSRIQILHAHMENALLLSAAAAFRNPLAPAVVYSHYDPETLLSSRRMSFLFRRATDGLVVLTEAMRQAALSQVGFAPDRVAVIEPGIDHAFFHPDRPLDGPDLRKLFGSTYERFTIGMVTRIRNDRKVDQAVEAVRRLLPEHPGIRLLIIGRGEALEALRTQVRSHGMESHVLLGGYRRGEELAASFRCMDVLLYPEAGSDKSCRTIREALAAGVPVCAVRKGFIPELLSPGRTGVLFDEGIEAMTRALGDLVEGKAGLPAMRQACLQEAATRFTLARQADKTLAFYDTLRS